MNNDGMAVLSVAALLPDSIGPYLALMGGGFGVAILGYLSGSKTMVLIGVLMVFCATLLFPIALQLFSDEPPPPGPKVPLALVR
jgi:hypothetical protein